LSSPATELVGRAVTVIVTWDVPSCSKAATENTPTAFLAGIDLVKLGLMDGLNQPRGNVTGATMQP